MGPKLRDRIALYPDSVGRFACLALVPERLPVYRSELTTNALLLGAVEAALQSTDPEWRNFVTADSQEMYTITPAATDTETPADGSLSIEITAINALVTAQSLLDRRAKLVTEQADLKRKIADCEKDASEEAVVVERTRHDYEPFIKEAARLLARDGRSREIHDPGWRAKAARKAAGGKVRGRPAKGKRGGKK